MKQCILPGGLFYSFINKDVVLQMPGNAPKDNSTIQVQYYRFEGWKMNDI